MVRHIAALSLPVHLGTEVELPWFKVLQHGSTIVGSLVVFMWARQWLRQQPTAARKYNDSEWSHGVQTAALLLCASLAGALVNGWRGISRGPVAGLGYAAVGGMAALILTLVVVGWLWRPPQPGT